MSHLAAKPTGDRRRRVDWRVDWLPGFVAAFSFLPLFARHWWVGDLIANLRVQLIIGMSGATLLLLITRRWRMMLIITALTLWQATALHSAFQTGDIEADQSGSTVDSAAGAEGEQRLRVFLANVLTRNQRHDQIIAQIRAADPDVIAILELSSTLKDSLQREFSSTYTYSVSESQDHGNFGIGLWSRYPLSHARVFHLNVPILPSIEADIQLPSGTIHVIATHPLPPVGARNFGHRNQHLALLSQRIRKQQQVEPSCSQILVGDLNLTPWSPMFEDFLASTGLQNAAAGRGLQPTWYRWPAFPFGLLLDHGLHSQGLRCDRRSILAANGSDHRAVVFDFSVDDSR
ncbi:MAG: endonuclease/exonuclease/phosphatase family protein [Planctomycetaceae bacterium]